MMTYIQVRKNYQVTIPASIRKKAVLQEGDILEVMEKAGAIILVPKRSAVEMPLGRTKSSLLSLAGANESSGLYVSAQEIDEYTER